MLGVGPAAHATTYEPLTLAQQSAVAPVIVEARITKTRYRVLDDGYPVREILLEPIRAIRLSDATRELWLGLPGGYDRDGGWWGEGYPEFDTGQVLLVFARPKKDGVLITVGGPQSFFVQGQRKGDSIARDADGNPIVDDGCKTSPLIARPEDQAPIGEVRGGEDGLPAITPSDRMFVADPTALALAWTDFSDQVAECVASNPRTVEGGR